MSRAQTFMEWIALSQDVQQLASIIQNDVPLTEEDWYMWLLQVDNFKVKFEALKLQTMRLK